MYKNMVLTEDEYMKMARIARKHADCKKRHVGAVIVLPSGLVIPGANGSPIGRVKCADGGCYRCANPAKFPTGVGYDVCTCVHAEEAAMAAALKAGVSLNGASIYSTLRPCRECSKVMLNAGIYAVYYEDDFTLENAEETAAYQLLQEGFLGGVHQVSTRSLSVDGIGVSVEVTTTKVN